MNNKAKKILFRYWLAALLLTTAGIVTSLYSAHSHYKNYTDPLYSSFCTISNAINCDTVAQSPWSIMMGVPVAWWGFLFYLFFLFFLLTGKSKTAQAWRGYLYVALVASTVTLALAGVAVWKIKSLCLVCLTIYAITFALTYVSWIGTRRCKELGGANAPDEQNNQAVDKAVDKKRVLRNYGLAGSVFFIGLLIVYLFLPRYWEMSSFSTDLTDIPHGLTEEGHPWVGAKNPQVTITQFSDYQCFQCGKMHFFLRQLLTLHPDTLRLVHRNYPMDHAVNPQVVPTAFHEGSGDLAKIAILAGIRDKFWQMNDLLYAASRAKMKEIPLQDLADKTGLEKNELAAALSHPDIKEMLRRDIWWGMKLGITGTPAFLIDGKVYQGHIPKEILEKIATLPEKK